MPRLEGVRSPDERKARVRLTVREPFIESLLAGLDFDGVDLDHVRAFGKRCWSERNRFDIRRRGSGLFGSRMLDKRDADRVLKSMLADLQREGAI